MSKQLTELWALYSYSSSVPSLVWPSVNKSQSPELQKDSPNSTFNCAKATNGKSIRRALYCNIAPQALFPARVVNENLWQINSQSPPQAIPLLWNKTINSKLTHIALSARIARQTQYLYVFMRKSMKATTNRALSSSRTPQVLHLSMCTMKSMSKQRVERWTSIKLLKL